MWLVVVAWKRGWFGARIGGVGRLVVFLAVIEGASWRFRLALVVGRPPDQSCGDPNQKNCTR